MDEAGAREEYRRLGKEAEVLRVKLNEYMKKGVPADDIRYRLAMETASRMQEIFVRMRELEDIFTE